jgi:phage baseplate assembly protein V
MAGMLDDALRILANLIRYGTVATVDVDIQRVTIKTGGVTTKPLPWITPRAGRVRIWNPPSIGEQVMVVSPNGDLAAGVAMPALFSNALPKPDDANADNVVMAFGDGAVLLYDMATHLLKASLPAGGRVEAIAPDGFKLTGDVDIAGKLHVSEAVTFDSTLHADSDITTDADVKAGPISLKNHPHDKVQPGSGISGKPVAS